MQHDVLLIDDEVELADATAEYLRAFGLSVVQASSAEDGLAIMASAAVGVVLLDVNLPGMNGFAGCRRIRMASDAPIIFISARVSDDDQILAMSVGGDDYVTKPFSLAVLLAKVRRALSRTEAAPRAFDDGRLRVDDESGRTFLNGTELSLPTMEDRLLRYLIHNAGKVVTKQQLFDDVWEEPFAGEGTLAVHIRRLRRRIEVDPDNPRYIKTVWGRGYLFEAGE